MKIFLVLAISLLSLTTGYCGESEAARKQKQTELDNKCEAARQIALAPLKQEILQECLEKGKDELVCRNEANEYDGGRANRGPMFYDLPECEKAFDYKKGS